MTILNISQARQYASDAGFKDASQDIIVAIAQAESGLNTNASNTAGNSPPSTDRGVLQINDYWHPEVPDSCAYDAKCAFSAGYTISRSGTDFTPWTTYTNGAYKKYMKSGFGAEGGGAPGIRVVSDIVVVTEDNQPFNGSGPAGGGPIQGCVEASVLMAVHSMNKNIHIDDNAVGNVVKDAYYANQVAVTNGVKANGSMTPDNARWLFKQFGYDVQVVGAGWQAQLDQYVGKLPLVLGFNHARNGLGGDNSNVDGHAICVFGYDPNKGYICGDPNTQESQRHEVIYYSRKQFTDSEVGGIYIPSTSPGARLSQWVSNLFNAAADNIPGLKDVKAAATGLDAIGEFFSSMSRFFTIGTAQTNNVIRHNPGFGGICQTINDVEKFPGTRADLSTISGWIGGAGTWGKVIMFRSMIVLVGLIIFIFAFIMLVNEELAQAIASPLGQAITGAAKTSTPAGGIGKVRL